MKRALVAASVMLGLLACSSFGSSDDDPSPGTPDAATSSSSSGGSEGGLADGGSGPADAFIPDPDASSPTFCTGSIACDQFEAALGADWKPGATDYSMKVESGVLQCGLPSNDAPTGAANACQIERELPAGKMRIELDLTFHPPNDFHGHNVQVLALYNGTSVTRTYLGLYVQNPTPDRASLVLTVAHFTGSPVTAAVGSIPYSVATHIVLDVSFGNGSELRLEAGGASDGTHAFESYDAEPVTLLLGLARQNGGTDALRAEYDNFRVLPIASF